MKKIGKILLATAFLCLLPVGSLFALSPEAKATIEEIRVRLLAEERILEKEKQNLNSIETYVPGKELAAALARYRKKVYYSKNRAVMPVQKDEPPLENTSGLDAPSGFYSERFEALAAKYREKLSGKAAQSQAPYELKTVEAKKAEEVFFEADGSQNVDKNEKIYIPGQLLGISIMRIRRSQRRETPASEELDKAIAAYEVRLAQKAARSSKDVVDKANEEIEEIFNNPEKRAKTAKAKRHAMEAQKATTSQNSNEIDDQKFNDYISRYDFKMPENYRILVD